MKLYLVLSFGLLNALPSSGVISNWSEHLREHHFVSMNTATIHKFDEFLICTGWKKSDLRAGGENAIMSLSLVDSKLGKPEIHVSVYGKSRTTGPFEFGKEFSDTMLSGKKARTAVNFRPSPILPKKKLWLDIEQKVEEDGLVVTHKMEILTEPEESRKSFALQGTSKCNKKVDMFVGWYLDH